MPFSKLFNARPLRLWVLTAAIAAVVFMITRFILLAHSIIASQQEFDGLFASLFIGIPRDLLCAAVVASPWAIFALFPRKKWRAQLHWPLFGVYVFTLFFVAVSETIFWDEFSVRFNFIAVDYLVFTTEVIGNIRESYPVAKIVTALLVLTLAVVWSLRRSLTSALSAGTTQRFQWLWVLLLVVATGYGAFKLPPPEFSGNNYANELADNGWRSFLWAARQNKLDYDQFYAVRPASEVMHDLEKLSGHGKPNATHEPLGNSGKNGDMKSIAHPNVVVVMMESLSAEYMGTFGSKDNLTPNLDRLAGEGMLFSRLYAAGTRTVRGLEALTAALPPLPGKSIVRWPNISNLNTLGSVLADRGWSPHFLYGGYGMFDNMNGYFGAQGYKVTDRTSFKDGLVEFENVWGVADEHLFDQTLIEIDKDFAAGRPFFGHIMTASNHVPFTYPDGRIDIPSPGKRPGGVKYADYAVGRFIEMAKKKPWFDNTIFLFVADHCASSSGKDKIPVHRYHIPAIVYAPKLIQPQRIDTLVSQIDLAPTMLAMLGLQSDDHFVGRDILSMKPEEGRALLSTYQNLGYLKGDVMTVLLPKQKIETYKIGPKGEKATPMPTDPKLAEEAIAYFQGAALLMDKHGENGMGTPDVGAAKPH